MAGELAIVLSGGGAKGAFQVGVLDALIQDKKVNFNIAVGTSTGAIQAAAVAQDDIPRLIQFWTSIKKPDDIYRKRGGLLLDIIGGKPSLYTTAPLQALLRQSVDDQKIKASGKRLRIGIVNLTTGTEEQESMDNTRVFRMAFASVYPHYITKAEKKGRTKEEVNAIIHWLTGYDERTLQQQIDKKVDFETFFARAPRINPNVSKITGVICGYRVEEIEDKLMQQIRYLDKLVDELAKGKAMDKILRK